MEPRVFYRVTQGISNPPDVIKGLYTFTPAVLHDHCRHRVRGEDYPAVIAEPGQSVLGTFVTGLTDANIEKLDQFEGSEYIREVLAVKLVTKAGNAKGEGQVEGEARTASVYIFINPDRVEKGEWDFEHFRKEKLHMWARDEIFFSDDGELPRNARGLPRTHDELTLSLSRAPVMRLLPFAGVRVMPHDTRSAALRAVDGAPSYGTGSPGRCRPWPGLH